MFRGAFLKDHRFLPDAAEAWHAERQFLGAEGRDPGLARMRAGVPRWPMQASSCRWISRLAGRLRWQGGRSRGRRKVSESQGKRKTPYSVF